MCHDALQTDLDRDGGIGEVSERHELRGLENDASDLRCRSERDAAGD